MSFSARSLTRPVATAAAQRLRDVVAVSLLTLATAVSAWIVIPLPGTPVPITLQTFTVLAGAGLLGARRSLLAQAAYLVLGGIGLPWFAGGAVGGPVFLGATGGYLLGFLLASAWVGSRLSVPPYSWLRNASVLIVADTLLFACGVAWLALFLHVSPARALVLGLLPFLPGEALKLAGATALLRAAGPWARKQLPA